MTIDKAFVEKYCAKANGAKAFGISIECLSREELTAVLMATLESAETTNRELKKLLDRVSALGMK